MSSDIISFIIMLVLFAANMILLFQLFPCRFDLRVSIGILALFTICELLLESLTGPLRFDYGGLRGLLYFPLLLFLLKGTVFQKLFAFSLELVFTVSVSFLVSAAAGYLFGDGTIVYNVVRLAVLLMIYTAYAVIVTKKRRIVYEKLFAHGSTREWVIYSFVGLFSFGVMAISRITAASALYFIIILLFILLSFSVLCFAVVNTNEKSRQRYEADFAREVMSSGRDHYQKMDELYEKLRILRHDYKYHLSAAREMLRSGDADGADKYLTDVEKQLSEYAFPNYCPNPVINALVASYEERCKKSGIEFAVDLPMLKTLKFPNYELCIIVGNLLENAVEACEKLENNRRIKIAAEETTAQFMFMVENSFNGVICQDEKAPVSTKTNGGVGLRSVRTVAVRYGGDLFTEWNNDTFTAYVTLLL